MSQKQRIIEKAIELVNASPQGKRYTELLREICAAFPGISRNAAQGALVFFRKHIPDNICQPTRGLYRAVSFQEQGRRDPEQGGGHMRLDRLYPTDPRSPGSLGRDLESLAASVTSWRAKDPGTPGWYGRVAATLGFETEFRPRCLGRKRIDLYKAYPTGELQCRVAVEVEASTIENAYNDLLKIMQLLKSDEVDYGVVIFIQNNRPREPKLTAGQVRRSIVESFDKVLEDFRGRLSLYQGNPLV